MKRSELAPIHKGIMDSLPTDPHGEIPLDLVVGTVLNRVMAHPAIKQAQISPTVATDPFSVPFNELAFPKTTDPLWFWNLAEKLYNDTPAGIRDQFDINSPEEMASRLRESVEQTHENVERGYAASWKAMKSHDTGNL